MHLILLIREQLCLDFDPMRRPPSYRPASSSVLSACGAHGASSSVFSAVPDEERSTHGGSIGPAQAYALSPFMADTSVGIHALQVFDEAHGFTISAAEGAADGQRYASVWGVRSPHMASAWHTENAGLERADLHAVRHRRDRQRPQQVHRHGGSPTIPIGFSTSATRPPSPTSAVCPACRWTSPIRRCRNTKSDSSARSPRATALTAWRPTSSR